MDILSQQKQIIEDILQSYENMGGINHLSGENLPSRQSIHTILNHLKEILFPGYFEKMSLDVHNLPYVTGQKVVTSMDSLKEEIAKSFYWQSKENSKKRGWTQCEQLAQRVTLAFMKTIPELRRQLKEDANAIFQGDPAAKNEPEIILAYPGFLAVTIYRIAHFLYQKKVPLIPRIMTEISHSQTGIDIHPGARIGRNFCIDHGSGIVIGETAEIGNHVKLYQGVTIGALSVLNRNVKGKRHPTIEDRVTIYARTTILGGDTVIGANTIIGGNVWLTHSVPKNSKVVVSPKAQQLIKTG